MRTWFTTLYIIAHACLACTLCIIYIHSIKGIIVWLRHRIDVCYFTVEKIVVLNARMFVIEFVYISRMQKALKQ